MEGTVSQIHFMEASYILFYSVLIHLHIVMLGKRPFARLIKNKNPQTVHIWINTWHLCLVKVKPCW